MYRPITYNRLMLFSSKSLSSYRMASSSAQSRAYDYYRKQGRLSVSSSLSQTERNQRMAWYASAIIIGAVGATYASVPLYKIFCQATGFGGTTQRVTLPDWANDQESKTGRIVRNLQTQLLSRLPNSIVPKMSSSSRVHTWTDEEAAEKLASLKPVTNGRLITVRFDTTVGEI